MKVAVLGAGSWGTALGSVLAGKGFTVTLWDKDVPVFPADAKGLLKAAIRDENPVLVMESETLYSVKGDLPDDLDVMGLEQVAEPAARARAERIASPGTSIPRARMDRARRGGPRPASSSGPTT